MLKPVHYAAVALAAVIGGLGGTYVATRGDKGGCGTAVVAGGNGAVGGPFTLIDENSATVTDKEVITGPTLVYFGYTYCPDICPTDVARNVEAVDLLEQRGYMVTPVLISVDPGRDTPQVLKEWTDYLHPRLLGLTGTEDQILAAAKAYKTVFKLPDDRSGNDYVVDHMTQTYLMLPGAGFVEFFTRDATPEDIAAATACFIDASA